jgi:hypothetical protein
MKKSITVESLDYGFIITEEGKQKAFANIPELESYLADVFRFMLTKRRIGKSQINIEVNNNIPTVE